MKWLNLIVIIFFQILILSCSHSEKNQNSTDELLIKDSISPQKNNQQNSLSDLYITPPADSSYTGDAEERYPNGVVKYKGFYRFGKRHGEWLYFYPNGNLWTETNYNRGKINGYHKVYHPNGKLYYVSLYKNDVKDSIWAYYDTSGKIIMMEYYQSGQLIKRERK